MGNKTSVKEKNSGSGQNSCEDKKPQDKKTTFTEAQTRKGTDETLQKPSTGVIDQRKARFNTEKELKKIHQKPSTGVIDQSNARFNTEKEQKKTPQKPSPGIIDQRNARVNTEKELKDKLLVASIDVGTTYSRFAYLTKWEYKKDKTRLHGLIWRADGGVNHKAPTTVLFKPNKTFHSFGYDAEEFYNKSPENMDLKEWYYFKHFKMKLYSDQDILTKDTVIEDSREIGHTMKALDVFAAVIEHFKNSFINSLKERCITNDDIHWVLTVPATWNTRAKQFMQDAAKTAGINSDQLTLVLEPEAASLYCRNVPYFEETTKHCGNAISAMQQGSRYIVLNLGGGATDVTVHEVTGPDTLKEIHQACGGHFGGNTVNQEFFKFLSRLFGGPVINKIRTKHPSDYFELMNNFELRKIRFIENEPADDKSLVTFRIPLIWLEVFFSINEETLIKALPNTAFNGKIAFKGDKIRINNKLFRSFFDYSIENVLKMFQELFKTPEIAKINILLAIGGYSRSPVLIEAIKAKFPHLDVIVPPNPDLAVLNGAIWYGFEPHSITRRVS